MPTEILINGDFAAGMASWYTYGVGTATPDGAGHLAVAVLTGSTFPWDAGIGQASLPLTTGQTYTLTFQAAASIATRIRVDVQLADSPFTDALAFDLDLIPSLSAHTYTFVAPFTTTNAQVVFQVGGAASAYTLTLGPVALTEPSPPAPPGTPRTVFPDARLAALEVLRDRVPTYAAGIVFVTRDYDPDDPDRPALPYVKVGLDATFGQYPVTRTATLRLVTHATTEAAALDIAGLCQAVLLAYEGGAKVRSFGELTGPIPTTDTTTGGPVAFLTLAARLRPQPLE